MDCGDNSCEWATSKGGMRTNGGCRCVKDLTIHATNASGWVLDKAGIGIVIQAARELRQALAEAKEDRDRKVQDLISALRRIESGACPPGVVSMIDMGPEVFLRTMLEWSQTHAGEAADRFGAFNREENGGG